MSITSTIRRYSKLLQQLKNNFMDIRYLSNKSAWITKIHRKLYLRKYPTLVVQPSGSTYKIRHFEPRGIIKLPLDFSMLSDEEKEIILEKRKPKKKVVIEEEIDDNFDSSKYVTFIRKKAAAKS